MYGAVRDLSLVVDDWTLSIRERDTSSGFTRTTTVVTAVGPDDRGNGEDVTYESDAHYAFAEDPPDLPTGEFTFDGFSAALGDVSLFAEPPEQDHARHFRRWAVESAALDLALRQADTHLGAVLGRSADPVSFVASTRLGDPPTADRVHDFLDVHPDLRFKLDPTPEWPADLFEELAATDAVALLDLKGLYEGTSVDAEADPELYRRVFESFPDAVVEDPDVTDVTREVVERNSDRVSWDYPITGIESVRELPFEPSWLNVKPSRFGTVESLLETVEYCERRDIELYGGGQFELDVGRGQIQYLASLCYPDAPNDVAPGAYNDPEVHADLPASPLTPPRSPAGFRWD